MKSTGIWSSNELYWLNLNKEHQDCSPSSGHHGDVPYYHKVGNPNTSSLDDIVKILPMLFSRS